MRTRKVANKGDGVVDELAFAATREAAAAKALPPAAGASTGPLYATALMRAGTAAKGKAELDDAGVVAMVAAMAPGIADRGKAEPGYETMLGQALVCGARKRTGGLTRFRERRPSRRPSPSSRDRGPARCPRRPG